MKNLSFAALFMCILLCSCGDLNKPNEPTNQNTGQKNDVVNTKWSSYLPNYNTYSTFYIEFVDKTTAILYQRNVNNYEINPPDRSAPSNLQFVNYTNKNGRISFGNYEYEYVYDHKTNGDVFRSITLISASIYGTVMVVDVEEYGSKTTLNFNKINH